MASRRFVYSKSERSSTMKMRETLRTLSKKAIGLGLAIAVALPVFAAPQQAQAHRSNRWVGPAIVGLIIGGIIADQAYRHNNYRRHYVYDPYPYGYPRYKHRRVITYGYPGPVYYPYPVYRPGIYFSW
jgi:hypothetical protein